MIASALHFARVAPGTTMALVVALAALIGVGFDGDGGEPGSGNDGLPTLTPIRRTPHPPTRLPAGSALFDPGRRDETLTGSIDDLRPKQDAAIAPSATVEITGVLIGPTFRKAMFKVAGAPPVWIDADADVGGWHVAAIDGEGAMIERGGDTLNLKIADRYKHRSSKPANDSGSANAGGPEGGAPAVPGAVNPETNPADPAASPNP